MRKYLFISALVVFMLVVMGCSNNRSNSNNEEIVFIDVEIKSSPSEPKVNEKITIQTIVTFGDEKVDDADEVSFEIWKEGEEAHEKIPAIPKGEGIYSIETTFDEPGLYNIISHVTARDMHNMPRIQVTVKE